MDTKVNTLFIDWFVACDFVVELVRLGARHAYATSADIRTHFNVRVTNRLRRDELVTALVTNL